VVELVGGFSSCWRRQWKVQHRLRCGVGVDLDAVADGVGGPEGEDGFGGEALFRNDAGEQRLRVGEELGGFAPTTFVFEISGKRPWSSHALKNGPQSMKTARFVLRAETSVEVRVPRNSGVGMSDGGPVEGLAAGAGRRGRGAGVCGAALGELGALALLLRGDVGEEGGFCSVESRALTTFTTREASSTWTTPARTRARSSPRCARGWWSRRR
jgi:hypothetical protein